MVAKKVAAFPDNVMERLAKMKAVHDRLPVPHGAGSRIAMQKA